MKSHTDIIDETLGVTDMVEIPKPELRDCKRIRPPKNI